MREAFWVRVFFCLVPAIFATALLGTIQPLVGVLAGVCVFGFGWDVTKKPKG